MSPDIGSQENSKNSISPAEQSDSWLVRAWKSGDEQAAEILFDRYALRLIALVASRLNRRFRSSIDPNEVVQSAMGSFFNAARHSRLEISRGVSLWRLLATFARRKMSRRIEFESAAKRGGSHERVSLENAVSLPAKESEIDGNDNVGEFLRQLDSELPESLSSVVRGILSGQTQQELAQSLGIDERTVRRRLNKIRKQLSAIDGTTNSAGCDSPSESFAPPASLPQVSYNTFVLGKMIGSGGFGKVYRASLQTEERTVAVKFLRKAYWQVETARASFLREINLASQIQHPGIIRYLGYGESPQGAPYLLSEWIDGRSLLEIENPSTEQIGEWLLQICKSIQAVHRVGLVHGDLAPSNVLIDHDERVVITDFGFSQTAAPQPQSHSDVEPLRGGTLGFAAPEQIDSCFGQIGPATDIYAIGGLLHWLLFGTPPNAGLSLGQMIAATTQCDEELDTRIEECVPSHRTFLAATLRTSPADRTNHIDDLIGLLS